ncbi:hypothetical protein AAAC51_39350 [Priestia megaterium]
MSQTTIPRAAVRGTASGVIFMAFLELFGQELELEECKGEFPVLITLSLLIGVILFIGAIVLMKNSRQLTNEVIKRMGIVGEKRIDGSVLFSV